LNKMSIGVIKKEKGPFFQKKKKRKAMAWRLQLVCQQGSDSIAT